MLKYFIQALILYFQLCDTQKEHEQCVDSYVSSVGNCTKVGECRSALDDYKLNGIQPTFCSPAPDGIPVVCCRDGNSILQTSGTTKPWSFGQQPSEVQSSAAQGDGLRISQQKCQNYSRIVRHNINFISLLLKPEVLSVSIAKCNYDNTALIVGGQDAEVGEFPHMAVLGWPLISGGYALKCGGSLISEKFVLTAGHCTKLGRDSSVSSSEPTVVRMGDHNINPAVDDGAQPVEVPIRKIIPHPDYHAPLRYNDIALVEMASAVEFSAQIRPACLWAKPVPSGKMVATGWGQTGSGRQSQVLQKVSLDFIEAPTCAHYVHKHRHWPSGLARSQLCAGVLGGGKDTCQGDSGGPLQVVSADNYCIFHVVGVTSFGGVCAAKNQPGVYTKVSAFVDWIESIVWQE